MRINAVAAGLAFGIFWAIGLVGVAVINRASLTLGQEGSQGYGAPFIVLMNSVYPGYGTDVGGVVLGAVWGLVDGFVSVAVFAWLYNVITGKLEKTT